jgi:hypothetical protein
MATSYWKTLKTVENLAETPDLTPGTLPKSGQKTLSFLFCVNKFEENFKNL